MEEPRHAVASLSTDDKFPFAGFVRGDDIVARLETRPFDSKGVCQERAVRRRLVARLAEFSTQLGLLGSARGVTEDIVKGDAGVETGTAVLPPDFLSWPAASPGDLALVHLQHLWLETRPQNVSGNNAD